MKFREHILLSIAFAMSLSAMICIVSVENRLIKLEAAGSVVKDFLITDIDWQARYDSLEGELNSLPRMRMSDGQDAVKFWMGESNYWEERCMRWIEKYDSLLAVKPDTLIIVRRQSGGIN